MYTQIQEVWGKNIAVYKQKKKNTYFLYMIKKIHLPGFKIIFVKSSSLLQHKLNETKF